MKIKFFVTFVLFIMLNLVVSAQKYEPIKSPVIAPDGTVTFSYLNPKASKVELSGQFMKGTLPFEKGENGIWTITFKPEVADIYPYNFIVDGVSISDPANPFTFPNENFKASLLTIPNPDALYTIKNVPHGHLEYRTYYSPVLKEYRPLIVYVPAEYVANPLKDYPVFYLISGTTDTEETWTKVGKANVIMDNLIASGEACPMIVVMPYGYMNCDTLDPTTMKAADMYEIFAHELTQAIMPYVETNYRTINDREHRAIAGFSRGGGQSMYSALKHPELFGFLGSYSAYLTPEVMEAHFPNLVEDANSLELCWMCVGYDDFLYKQVVENKEYFDNKGIKYQTIPHEGAHTWMHARFCLAQSAPKFFKKQNEQRGDVTVDYSTIDGFTLFRPTNLDAAVAQYGPLPVLVYGNGACSHDCSYYQPMFEEMVQNGYVVLAVADKYEASHSSDHHDFFSIGKDDNLLDGVDWAVKAANTNDGEFYRKLDPSKIAVSGHSCGGAQALAASYDPRIATTIMMNSGMGNIQMAGADTNSLGNLHAPILYLIGGPDDIAYGNAEIDYERINGVPVVCANFPVGHGGTYGEPAGGEMGQVALMWLDWQLRGDKQAGRFFTNPSWRKKNFPDCDYKSK